MSKNPYLIDSVKLDQKDNILSTDQNVPGRSLVAILDATHSGFVNGNFFFYLSDSMKESYHTWTTPYRRPVIVHHRLSDMETLAEDPIGRVYANHFIDDSRGGFTQLEAKITDEEAKQKIIDGRYLTVSTRVSPVDFVECTHCGTNLLTDGFCGHPRGKVIEDDESGEKKLTFWKIGRTRAKEVSFVNLPADQGPDHYAGVTNWEFSDQEHPDFSQAPGYETSNGIYVFDSQVVIPDTTLIKRFKDSPSEDLIVNKSLWEQNDGNIERYANMGGLVLIDHSDSKKQIILDNTNTAVAPSTKDSGNKDSHSNNDNDDDDILTDEEIAAMELTDDDLSIFDWLSDELDKELKAQTRARKLTNKVGDRGKIAHSHVASLNQAGNGYTDYVLGHSHRLVDNRITDAISDGAEKAHGHIFTKSLKIPKSFFDTFEAHVTGYANKKDSVRHRHVTYTNEAKNGDTDHVAGHSHRVVGGRILPATADGEQKPHTHKLGQMFDIRDQYLDDETWDMVDLPDAKMTEKQKKAADKAGKTFCGPHDKRKGRRSFPAQDCAHVRAGLRLLSRYKGPGDKSKIRACLKRQNAKLKCGVKAADEQSYAVIELLAAVLNHN